MVSIRAQKTLWGRAAGRCSFPGCRVEVFFEEEASDPTIIGENCHIIAENDGGPRTDSSWTSVQRNSYSNLILLCRNHHKIIDDPQNGERNFPIGTLHEMKRSHETWVRQQLDFDAEKQRDDEYYADIIDEWEHRVRLNEWTKWSYCIVGHRCPYLKEDLAEELEYLRRWLHCRIWPRRYPELDDAFENFRRILYAFQETFYEHVTSRRDTLITVKFYSTPYPGPDEHDRLLEQFEYHIRFTADLILELTRAANLICDLIRKNILHGYRLREGRLLVIYSELQELVVEYSSDERKLRFPFAGLDSFRTDREARDFCYGAGLEPS
jgi:hypothetical protein